MKWNRGSRCFNCECIQNPLPSILCCSYRCSYGTWKLLRVQTGNVIILYGLRFWKIKFYLQIASEQGHGKWWFIPSSFLNLCQFCRVRIVLSLSDPVFRQEAEELRKCATVFSHLLVTFCDWDYCSIWASLALHLAQAFMPEQRMYKMLLFGFGSVL